jgi:hypothetical protein
VHMRHRQRLRARGLMINQEKLIVLRLKVSGSIEFKYFVVNERHRILLVKVFRAIQGTYQQPLKCHRVVYLYVQGRKSKTLQDAFKLGNRVFLQDGFDIYNVGGINGSVSISKDINSHLFFTVSAYPYTRTGLHLFLNWSRENRFH